mgnify:CR=1 FL=1
MWDFGNGEDKLAVRDFVANGGGDPVAGGADAALVTGGTKVAALAGEGEEAFVVAVRAMKAEEVASSSRSESAEPDHVLDELAPQEDQAAQYGLQGVPVGSTGETLYFGLVGTNSLDGLQMMPFLQPDKEKFLEYDLAKMVASLSHPEHAKVGLISGLEMQAGFDPATQNMREAWVIHQQFEQSYAIEKRASLR